MTATNLKCIHEEIKICLNSGNACHHTVQRLYYSCLLSKNCDFTCIAWCETWSLTLWEQQSEVFDNRVLRRIFGLKRE
jgi:hypothetical protein